MYGVMDRIITHSFLGGDGVGGALNLFAFMHTRYFVAALFSLDCMCTCMLYQFSVHMPSR